jgi:hypothetical protein
MGGDTQSPSYPKKQINQRQSNEKADSPGGIGFVLLN